jgi:hypothetical protein
LLTSLREKLIKSGAKSLVTSADIPDDRGSRSSRSWLRTHRNLANVGIMGVT